MKPIPRKTLPGLFEGALGIREMQDGLQPIRLPVGDLDFHHPSLRTPGRGEAAAGIRLRLLSNTRHLALEVRHDVPELRPGEPVYDLVNGDGNIVRARAEPITADVGRVVFNSVSAEARPAEIWLPPGLGVVVRSLLVDDGADIAAAPDPSPRWVVYGSSITHCAWVPGPTDTWPAIAARSLGWHLTCLGYNGGCHLDPFVARAMARLRADQFTLKLGINVHNLQTLRERTFAPLVHGFIQTLRDAHPTTPIAVISPIISPERENSPVSMSLVRRGDGGPLYGDLTLNQMRDILREAVELLARRGDEAIEYVDGRALLGEADAGRLPDGVHPDPAGYAMMGRRFADHFSR